MKLSNVAIFLSWLLLSSCGDPVTIRDISKPVGAAADSKKQEDAVQTQEAHVSPCGSFVGNPSLDSKISLVSPTTEQKIAIEQDGRAFLAVTVQARTNVTCLELFTRREGDDGAGQWSKLSKERVSNTAVAQLKIELSLIGRNEVALRAWSDGEPGAIVVLPNVDVVVEPKGEEVPSGPATDPNPAPQPAPPSDPVPVPVPTPSPVPESTWKYSYYEGVFAHYPDFAAMTPVSTGATWNFGMDEKGSRSGHFAFVYEGESWVNGNPEVSGIQPFTFFLKCDEGCRLYVNNFLVVENYPSRGSEKSGVMNLSHRSIMSVKVEYFHTTGAENLEVHWAGPKFEKTPLKSDFLP